MAMLCVNSVNMESAWWQCYV